MIETSVIIVNWNSCFEDLNNLKKALSKQTYKDFEIIFVDNNSTQCLDWKKVFNKKNCRIIQLPKNEGFAGGVNQGVDASESEYIALINTDAIPEKEWLFHLIQTLKKHKRVGTVSSLTYNKYGAEKHEAYFGTSCFFGQNMIYKNQDFKTDLVPVFGMSGGACAFRNEGSPFDGDYFLYSEDTYYGWIQRLEGKINVVCKKSVTWHEGEKSTKKLGGLKVYYQERNRLLNVLILYEFKTLMKLIPLLVFNVIAINIYDLRNIIPRVTAYFWIFLNMVEIVEKREMRRIISLSKRGIVSDYFITKAMSCKFYEEKLVPEILRPVINFFNYIQKWYCFIFSIKTIDGFKLEYM